MSEHDDHKALASRIPTLPRDEDGPVFAEPWQAQAFAMAVELSRKGLFTWSEWAETLGAEIAGAVWRRRRTPVGTDVVVQAGVLQGHAGAVRIGEVRTAVIFDAINLVQ